MTITLNGSDLTVTQVVAAARHGETVALAPGGSALSAGHPDNELSPSPLGGAVTVKPAGRSPGPSRAAASMARVGTTGPGGAGGGGGEAGFVVGLAGTDAFTPVVAGVVVVTGGVVEVGADDEVTVDVGVDDSCVGPTWACGVPPVEHADASTAMTTSDRRPERRMPAILGSPVCRDRTPE